MPPVVDERDGDVAHDRASHGAKRVGRPEPVRAHPRVPHVSRDEDRDGLKPIQENRAAPPAIDTRPPASLTEQFGRDEQDANTEREADSGHGAKSRESRPARVGALPLGSGI